MREIKKEDKKLLAALRRAFRKVWWMYSPERKKALERACRPYEGENKRQKKEYQCEKCQEWFKQSEVDVDHIEPIGKLSDYDALAGVIERLFCESEGLRILCKPCHKQRRKS